MPDTPDARIRAACARLATLVPYPLADLFATIADERTTGTQAAEAFERAAGELSREAMPQAP